MLANKTRSMMLNFERLQQLISQFASCRVAVVGDFFLDKYLHVDPKLDEPSVETGKTANQIVSVRQSPGAAGTVINNLAALGAGSLYAVGVIGADGHGYELRQALEELNCCTSGLIVSDRLMTPTYLKPRDVDTPGLEGEHSRYDIQNRNPMPVALTDRVLAELDTVLPELDAVIVADQVEQADCGVITAHMREALAARSAADARTVFWADSRSRIHAFQNMIIKPNQFEAIGHAQPGVDDVVETDRLESQILQLRQRTQCPVFVTRGPAGILVSDPHPITVPAVRVPQPVDTTGAGDSVTAGAVLALAAGARVVEAALVGNLVAASTIRQLATTGTARPEDLLSQLEIWQNQQN